jgi:hypothetical protein
MKYALLPSTKQGKWSIGLCIVLLLLTAINILGFVIPPPPRANTLDMLWLAIDLIFTSMVLILALASFITGIVSIKKYNDKSLLVVSSLVIGLLFSLSKLFSLLFIAGELLFPHA